MQTRPVGFGVPCRRVLRGGLAIALAGLWSAAAQPATTAYTGSIPSGLSPRMSPAEVAQVVMPRLARPIASVSADPATGRPRILPAPPVIISMSAIAGPDLPQVDPRMSPNPYPVVWYVRATGAFTSFRVPFGVPPIRGRSGCYLIDDATGNVVGMGIDRPPGSP
jgi:hypothetical protein